MSQTPEKREAGRAAYRYAVLALVFSAGLAEAAAAGELRAILEGEAALTGDGNYQQSAAFQDDGDERAARGGLSLRLSYDMKRSSLALVYSPSYEQSLDSGDGEGQGFRRDRSGVSHRLLFGFQGALTRRTELQIQERLFSSPNLDLYLPPTAPDTLAVTRRGDQLSHNFNASIRQALTERSGLTAAVSHSLRTFENSDLFDTESYGVDLGWSTNLDRDRSFGLSGGLGKFEYEDGRDADVRLAGVYYGFLLGRRTRARIDAGAFWVQSVNFLPLEPVPVPVDEKDSGWRGGVQLSSQGDLFNWSLGYRHDISAGYGLGRAAESDNAYFGLARSLGRRVTAGLDGSASRQRDLQQFADLRGDGDPVSELVTGTARLSWNIAPSLRLTGGYSRIWQNARIEPFDDLSYSRYFLGLAFRLLRTGETPKNPVRQEDLRTEDGETESGEDNP